MRLDLSYCQLPNDFYSKVTPQQWTNPLIQQINEHLACQLGFGELLKDRPTLLKSLLGYDRSEHSTIAQAYAGHQFGHFTLLGDGRAMLLGEYQHENGQRMDIHLKGSGHTPYSRRGDGIASLGPMLREYIISEAMHALGIPSTRSLAVITTGESIRRQRNEPGAILLRVAKSHIRVGSFEFAATQSIEHLTALLEYTLKRLAPELLICECPALALIDRVIDQQITLICHWIRVGFIHGVMNTDNMSISGETIDYGPCAFMNTYNPNKVFSSIDQQGRYAFANQPNIAHWNISILAQALLPLIDTDTQKACDKALELINTFPKRFNQYYQEMMAKKIGFEDSNNSTSKLVNDLLNIMALHQLDYTQTFKQLTYTPLKLKSLSIPELSQWLEDWQQLLKENQASLPDAKVLMMKHNPVVIPRNHLVEAALNEVILNENYSRFNALHQRLATPYQLIEDDAEQQPPEGFDQTYQTFCGT